MLSRNSVDVALPIVEELLLKGKTIQPVDNTVVAELARLGPIEVTQESTLSDLANQVLADQNMLVGGESKHNILIDSSVSDLVAILKKHIQYNKTVVLPFINSLVEKTREYLNNYTPDEIAKFSVESVVAPEPFVSDYLLADVTQYKGGQYDGGFVHRLNLPELSAEEIKKYMSVRVAGIDKAANAWADRIGDDKLEEYWRDTYTAGSKYLGLFTVNNLIQSNGIDHPDCDYDRLVFAYITACALLDNPPNGTAMSLSAFNSELGIFIKMLGLRLFLEITKYHLEMGKAKTLVYRKQGTKIYVYEDTYSNFLERGGDANVLLGYLVDGGKEYSVDDVLARADHYRGVWSRYTAIQYTTDTTRRFIRTKDTLISFFHDAVMSDEDLVLANKDVVVANFKREVDKLTIDDVSSIRSYYGFLRNAVCATRFPHTDAQRFLSSMDRIGEANPKLEPRAAASLAMIEFISYWLARQLRVVSR